MKKIKILLIVFLSVFSLNIYAQSHNLAPYSTCRYAKKMKGSSEGGGGCAACDVLIKKEEAAKKVEDKKRYDKMMLDIAAEKAKKKADDAAKQKAFEEKQRIAREEEKARELTVGNAPSTGSSGSSSSSNSTASTETKKTETNTTPGQIPDSYTGNPLHYNKTIPSASTDKFTQNVEAVGEFMNAAAPLLQGWANKHNAKVAARDAAREKESDQNTDLRIDFKEKIKQINKTLSTKEGFDKYYIKQIPNLLESPTPTWEKLLGSQKYADVFGKDIEYISKNFKPRSATKKDLRKALENGGMYLPEHPAGIFPFYAAYTNNGIDNHDNSKFIFDEKNIVIGIMKELHTSIGNGPRIPIEEYISDLYKIIGNDYILLSGNTILLKDKIILINHDELLMYDLKYLNDRILLIWPASYLIARKGLDKLYAMGISFQMETDENILKIKQLENLLYKLKDKTFYKIVTSDKGVVIKTLPGSPAEKAGLKSGDIITEMNGIKVSMPYMMQLITEGYAKEGKFNITYIREDIEYKTILSVGNKTEPLVMFQDDFSSNNNKWQEENSVDYGFKIISGKYRIESKKGGSWFTSIPIQINSDSDFEISATFNKVSGTNGYYFGMILGKNNSTGYHHFAGITGNGNYVFADKGLKPADLIPNSINEVVNKGNATNFIVIRKKDNLFKLYINGRLMGETPYKKFFGDSFGFQLWSGTDNLIVDVDNVIIQELN